jgi:hypothetical protein
MHVTKVDILKSICRTAEIAKVVVQAVFARQLLAVALF